MSFVAELKQRKVFRVATLYLVVAWIAVQVASIALPAFDAPLWVLRVVILLIALGFPFAVVLAWALEVTPEGLRFSAGGSGSKRIAVVASLLVALALVWYFRGQPALRTGDAISAAGTPAPAASVPNTVEAARSIAVLPFVNMSNDPGNDYFSDGLAETTLDMLAQVPDLKVVARTSSFAFKGKSDDVRRIGAALGAATLLEGSVQRAGDAVRITAQLVKASDGTHLWSKHFDRQLADVFKIQDEVATEVVRALEVSLPAGDQQRLTQKRTENVEAYQEYLKGIALMPGRKVEDMRAAAAHFEKAIMIDGTYARAYVAAADAYELLGEYEGAVAPADKAHTATYIDRALVLAPDLGEAHASRGTQLLNARDFDGAEREFQRATELAPSYASAFQWHGELLCHIRRDFSASERMLRHAVTLDPLSPIVQDQLVYPLLGANRLEAAKTELDKLLREHPDFAQGYYTQARFATGRGDLVGALRGFAEHAARDPAALGRIQDRCNVLERFSAIEPARTCLRDLLKRSPGRVEVMTELVQLQLVDSNAEAVLAKIKSGTPIDKEFEGFLLVGAGRVDEALPILRAEWPEQFASPAPKPLPTQIYKSVIAGGALLRSGATAQGRALLLGVIAELSEHPISAGEAYFAWWDVVAFEFLGDHERAIATLDRGVAASVILDLWALDADPLLTGLRADPRYEKILAPARARAAAQVAAAQAAGLL